MHASALTRQAFRPVSGLRTTPVARANRSEPKPLDVAVVSMMLSAATPALADEPAAPDAVDTVVGIINAGVKVTADVVKAGAAAAGVGLDIAKKGYEIAAPVVSKGIEVATPYVQKGIDAAIPAVKSSIDSVTPVISSSLSSATDSIKGSLPSVDIDTSALSSATSALTASAGKVSSVVDPSLLGPVAVGGAALLIVGPAVAGAFGSKGYAGAVPATSAQATLVSEGGCILVDLRAPNEKSKDGVPDLPSKASKQYVEVEGVTVEDVILKENIKDIRATEANLTAVQIASIRRLKKDAKLFLMDSRDTGSAQAVAKSLTSKGFTKVYVIFGGFSGKSGWIQSKLAIKAYSGTPSDLSGSGIFGTLTQRIGGSGTSRTGSGTARTGSGTARTGSGTARTGSGVARTSSGTAKTTSGTTKKTSTVTAKTSTVKAKTSTIKARPSSTSVKSTGTMSKKQPGI